MNLLNIFSFIMLCAPLIWELWNDRKGDANKAADVFVRCAGFILASLFVWKVYDKNFFTALNLSIAIHFMFFDYCIAAILIHNGTIEPPRGVRYNWFSYSGKVGVVDNVRWWKNLNPYVKLLIRVSYFVGSLVLYFTI